MATNDEIKEKHRDYVMEIYSPELDKMLKEARSEGYKEGQNAERQRCIENFKKVLSNLKEQQEEEYSRLGTPQQRIRNEGWLGCCSYLLNQLPKLFKKVD